jgi:fimbrial chaperone protein
MNIQFNKRLMIVGQLILFFLPLSADASEWRVSPIRLDLHEEARSGLIRVINDSNEKIHVQVKAMECVQDSEGKDRYVETSDIIYFPRIMILEKGEEKGLRAGSKGFPDVREKTYRLFIEEIPTSNAVKGIGVAIALRFGVPVFVSPQKTKKAQGAVEKIEMRDGLLKFVVKNTGNVQFRMDSIQIRGLNQDKKEIYSKDIVGWYLLNGASRPYHAEVPLEICGHLKQIEIEVKTSAFQFRDSLDLGEAVCAS